MMEFKRLVGHHQTMIYVLWKVSEGQEIKEAERIKK